MDPIKIFLTEKKPKDIPSIPARIYKDEWVNWFDWLGYYINLGNLIKTICIFLQIKC